MPSKTSEKNKTVAKELEKNISPILVINNSSLKPFVELFEYTPENIYQQPLGTLIGFFEVQEYSDNSAYIVNFLTSVLKKEYYANPKRSIEESFDASMHKVNLALSELAKHGNIEWLGKLNASICVLEKSGAHFSVSGNARMFLWRAGTLTDISEGLASEESSVHPLKTFINVSSGRLEKDDKLFITSDDLFKIMTENELIKNLQRLEGAKFVQFLKTACSNQLEMIASIVVDIQEEAAAEVHTAATGRKKKSTGNVFSKAAFEDVNETIAEKIASKPVDDFAENAAESDYTDKKTGHIYVQGENQSTENGGKTTVYLELAKENIASFWYHTKNITRRRFVLYKKSIAKSLEESRQKREMRKIELAEEKRLRDIARAKEQEELAILQEKERHERAIVMEKERQEREIEMEKEKQRRAEEIKIAEKIRAERKLDVEIIETEIAEEKPQETIIQQEEIIISEIPEIIEEPRELTFAEKLARAKQFQTPQQKEELSSEAEVFVRKIKDQEDTEEKISLAEKAAMISAAVSHHAKKIFRIISALCLKYARAIKEKIHQENVSSVREDYSDAPARKSVLAPHFSAIKKIYGKLNSQQKIGAIIALAAILIIPMFIARWMGAPKSAPTATTQQTADPSAMYANEKNIKLKTTGSIVLNDPTVVTTLSTTSGEVAITKTAVVMPVGSSSKNYPLPSGSGNAARATYMSSLNTIFILTDSGNVISFAPSVQKYSSNNINLSGISYSSFIGTYLTYLYVLDQQSNQIYRFPRAEGGFGDKTAWLKSPATLTNAGDMTIDDNIYVLQNNQVTKYTKGQATPMTLESSNTPVHFDHIYTTADSSSFYVIDTKNTRLVQYDKDTGVIIAQYYKTDLAGATSFSIDEQNKVAYVTTSSGVTSLLLQ